MIQSLKMPSVPIKGRLQTLPLVRTLTRRFGPAYWRLPASLRLRIVREEQLPGRFPDQTHRFGETQSVTPAIPSPDGEMPTLGHILAARPYRLDRPFITTVDRCWLVGKHAMPVTTGGQAVLTPFRDEPRILGLESHPDLLDFVENHRWKAPFVPTLTEIVPLVNRLEGNYYHWMVEWCGRLLWIEEYTELTGITPKLLIRGGTDAPRYLRPSLELLGFPSESIVTYDEGSSPVAAGSVIVPSLPGNGVACSPQSLRWLRQRFLKGAGIHTAGSPLDKEGLRLYIARKRGGWRSINNEDEVEECLKGFGFQTVRAETLSLTEQIRLFSKARFIVGLHGAGLTNLLFAPKASVLELFGSYGDGAYFSMATCLRNNYRVLSFPSTPGSDDVYIDVHHLSQSVADWLRSEDLPK